jgi:predicted aspartyl protease
VASTSIPFHAIRDRPSSEGEASNVEWGLVVSFNGKSRRLELDTGAHGLLLTRGAAASLGLPVESHTEAEGIGDNGTVPTSIAKVKDLKIGGLEFQDCAVAVLEKDLRVRNGVYSYDMMEGQDGLIGGDVFQDFLLTLDFPGHVVKLDPLPQAPGNNLNPASDAIQTGVDTNATFHDRYIDPSMSSWSKVFRAGHMLILPVRLNQGPIGLFVVDTGADVPLITPQAARALGHLEKGGGEIVGISGAAKQVYTTGPLTLDFAGLRQPSPGMVATESFLGGSPVELSGLLGQVTLRQLTIGIDYRDQLMKFTYDPNRITHCAQGMSLDDCY